MAGNKVEVVVLGAGAVGLAIGRALSMAGKELIILEKHASIGMETSSRNSEVIHRGMYYTTGSKMHVDCLLGRQLLLDYIRERNIPVNMCGKIILASSTGEILKLENIRLNAIANGIADLIPMTQKQVNELEPEIQCYTGLYSPNTAIFDSHCYMLSMQGDIESNQGNLIFNCEFISAVKESNGEFSLETTQGSIQCEYLVNSGGLDAVFNARNMKFYPRHLLPACYYAKGNYFRLAGHSPFKRLVYPLPHNGGLGVHCTLDMQGNARFGPDVEWLRSSQTDGADSWAHEQRLDTSKIYTVDPDRAAAFSEAVSQYWPPAHVDRFIPDYSGIRPKLAPPPGAAGFNLHENTVRNTRDFCLEGKEFHGIPCLVNIFGIESPGLTASLAIANRVQQLLLQS